MYENSNIPRGAHSLARETTGIYENTRLKLASFINARSEKEIVFVRGTTGFCTSGLIPLYTRSS